MISVSPDKEEEEIKIYECLREYFISLPSETCKPFLNLSLFNLFIHIRNHLRSAEERELLNRAHPKGRKKVSKEFDKKDKCDLDTLARKIYRSEDMVIEGLTTLETLGLIKCKRLITKKKILISKKNKKEMDDCEEDIFHHLFDGIDGDVPKNSKKSPQFIMVEDPYAIYVEKLGDNWKEIINA